jgi:hypothetical protein
MDQMFLVARPGCAVNLVPEDRPQEVRDSVLAALEPLREADGGPVMVHAVRYTLAAGVREER